MIKALDKKFKRFNSFGLEEESIQEIKNARGEKRQISANASIIIDLIEYQRGIIKIAYELGVYWLGIKYLNDLGAQKIRSCLLCEEVSDAISNEHWAKKWPIEGTITSYDDERLPLHFLQSKSRRNTHIAYLARIENKLVCCLKIFNLFKAVLFISEEAGSYPQISYDKYLEIDISTKKFTEAPLSEIFLKIHPDF